MEEKKPQIVWMMGYPCCGKTFMGDYLESQGWVQIDGDAPQRSTDPKDRATWADLSKAFIEWIKGEQPEDGLWKPYFMEIINRALKNQSEGKDTIITFVCYRRYLRDFVRTLIPDIKFI